MATDSRARAVEGRGQGSSSHLSSVCRAVLPRPSLIFWLAVVLPLLYLVHLFVTTVPFSFASLYLPSPSPHHIRCHSHTQSFTAPRCCPPSPSRRGGEDEPLFRCIVALSRDRPRASGYCRPSRSTLLLCRSAVVHLRWRALSALHTTPTPFTPVLSSPCNVHTQPTPLTAPPHLPSSVSMRHRHDSHHLSRSG